MKPPRSSRDLIKNWHRREKATIDHLVRTADVPKTTPQYSHSPFTDSGLAVEDQVRKAWSISTAGVPIF